MSSFEIPLVPSSQSLQVQLGSKAYHVDIIWRDADEGGWIADFYDAQTNAPVLRGVPLITGADLFAQYGYLRFGGQLTVVTDDNPNAVPTYGNLGVQSHLIWTPDA